MVKRGDMMSVEDVTEILAIHLLGVIPDDEQVVIATNQGEPIVGEDCMSGKAYANICRRLLGEEIPITDFGRSEGLFSKFRDLFKRIRRGRYECTICSHCERQTPESAHCGSAYVYTRYV